MNKFTQSEDYRRDELIRIIEHSVESHTSTCLSKYISYYLFWALKYSMAPSTRKSRMS